MSNATTDETINVLFQSYIKHFGIPNRIITDNGANFKSDQFKKFKDKLGIIHSFTTSYHQQSNGIVENPNKKLKNSIRSLNQKWYETTDYYVMLE